MKWWIGVGKRVNNVTNVWSERVYEAERERVRETWRERLCASLYDWHNFLTMTILCHRTAGAFGLCCLEEYGLKLDRTVQTAADLEGEHGQESETEQWNENERKRPHYPRAKMCKCVDFSFAVRPLWLFIVWADTNDVRETEILRNYDDDNNYGCMVLMVIAILMRWWTDTSVFFSLSRCHCCCFQIIPFNSFGFFSALNAQPKQCDWKLSSSLMLFSLGIVILR